MTFNLLHRVLARRLVACLLVTMHIVLVLYGIFCHSPTRNEVAHIPAGLAVWEAGNFSLYNVNPPLPRMLAALAVKLSSPDTRPVQMIKRTGLREEWQIAGTFAAANQDNYLELIRFARLVGLFWSLLGAGLVWRWATEIHGQTGGMLALCVWCIGPTVNAQAQLATPDLPAAVSMLLATYWFRRYLLLPSLKLATIAGITLGVALLCKFTAIILLPAWIAIACLYWLAGGAYSHIPFPHKLGDIAWVWTFAFGVLNLGYWGDGTLTRVGDYNFNSHLFCGPGGGSNRFHGTWLADIPLPLPYDYVSGIDWQRVDFEGRVQSYLRGEWRNDGWWYWYLYATVIKVPLGVLGLAGLGLVPVIRRPNVEGVAVWLPAVFVFVFVSANTGMTQHWRYILPAMPFAVVGLGAAGAWLTGPSRRRRWVAAVLLLWATVSSARCYPHTLSYFNELVGGPSEGWWHLTDSNVDWGQDLLFLSNWMTAHPEARPLHLGYSNFIPPQRVGVDLPVAPVDPAWGPADGSGIGPQPGCFAIEASSLVQDRIFFQRFVPVDRVGYSIFIYRITPSEANDARRAMGLPPLLAPQISTVK